MGDEQSLTVPVRKIVVAEPDPSMQLMPMLREEPPAATPAARMPQYQLHLRDLSAPVDANTSQLRFVLATPEGPMLIEAEIQIDGQPYQMAREQRVQEIMRFLADPDTYKAQIAKRQAEIDAAAAAAAKLEEAKTGLLETIKNLVTGENEAESDVRILLKALSRFPRRPKKRHPNQRSQRLQQRKTQRLRKKSAPRNQKA